MLSGSFNFYFTFDIILFELQDEKKSNVIFSLKYTYINCKSLKR